MFPSFFLGVHDRHLDYSIAVSYFNELSAPQKSLIWFDNSAHNISFEEPELFNNKVVEVLQPVLSAD